MNHKLTEQAEAAARNLLALAGHVAKHPQVIPQAAAEGVEWLVRGAPIASPVVLAERQAICGACAHWTLLPGSDIFHCEKCKCLPAKLRLATSACPVGKWQPERK